MAKRNQGKRGPATPVGGDRPGDATAPDRGADKRGKKPTPEAEIGGPKGPEPTRYGDWERKGIASDF